MKKSNLLIIIPCVLLIASCSNSGHLNSRNNPIASLFERYSSENEPLSTNEEKPQTSIHNNDESSYPVYDNIDIDLTAMNATMVYSEVYNMMDDPDSYVDKIVKVSGPFVPFESNDPNYCYPAIVVKDATACCANGLEFLLYGVPRCSMQGGNGYPLYNEEATIVGRFATYLEGSCIYVHLVDAIWIK